MRRCQFAFIAILLTSLTLVAPAQDKKDSKKDNKKAPPPKIGTVDKDPAGDKWDNAIEITTSHYRLQTDLSKEDGMKCAEALEQLFTFLCKEFKFDPKQAEENKLPYYGFKELQRYQQMRNKLGGRGIYGYVTQGKAYCYMKGRGFGGLYWTYIHEGTHQIMDRYLANDGECGSRCSHVRPGHWAVEGFACFAGSLKVKDDGSYVLGEENHSYLKNINFKNVDLSAYLQYDQNGVVRKQGENYMIGYALCHFLYFSENGKYRSKFMQYIKAIHASEGEADSFEKIIGVSPAKIKDDFVKYVDGLVNKK